ncbi:MAG TPA: proton-conducting transporter membrane subunit, partial [Herbaspirillum sp.]|nr:proton-conducting transporter membrane subunit [Herbaspirillum sp.]
GSVIIGMHHDQDMRNMGGLRKYLPITWITSLLGSLALIGTPFFSGFYSKDSIIEAAAASSLPGSGFAYFAVLASVFVTAFYSFRMYFMVFHGAERFGKAYDHARVHADAHAEHHGLAPGQKPHELPLVVTLPLILLAIPSVVIGFFAIAPMVFGDFFSGVLFIGTNHKAIEDLAREFHGPLAMAVHALTSAPLWLAIAGVVAAYYCYMVDPRVPAWFKDRFSAIYTLLDNKYYMDRFNEVVFAGGARWLGGALWSVGDKVLIDGLIVNGSARLVNWFSKVTRLWQSGYLYHYAFVMIIGMLGFLVWFMPFPFAK